MKRILGLAAVLVVLAGCGKPPATDVQSDFNTADVTFATEMIPHHAQALEMVRMTKGRALDPEVRRLVSRIRAEQAPEITRMQGWLKDWGRNVPKADAGMSGMSSMPGMMSDAQMSSLEEARGPAFQRQWLRLMIKHHQGAITMADTELQTGRASVAFALARSIKAGQSAEIAQMKQILGQG